MERCANCERPIGNLEEAYVFKDNPVCGACHAKLRADESVDVAKEIEYAKPSTTTPVKSGTLSAALDRGKQGFKQGVEEVRAERKIFEEKHKNEFSIVRVLGALMMIAGLPLLCVFAPLGIGLMLFGMVFIIAGK